MSLDNNCSGNSAGLGPPFGMRRVPLEPWSCCLERASIERDLGSSTELITLKPWSTGKQLPLGFSVLGQNRKKNYESITNERRVSWLVRKLPCAMVQGRSNQGPRCILFWNAKRRWRVSFKQQATSVKPQACHNLVVRYGALCRWWTRLAPDLPGQNRKENYESRLR